jgi:hypothetical protein
MKNKEDLLEKLRLPKQSSIHILTEIPVKGWYGEIRQKNIWKKKKQKKFSTFGKNTSLAI